MEYDYYGLIVRSMNVSGELTPIVRTAHELKPTVSMSSPTKPVFYELFFFVPAKFVEILEFLSKVFIPTDPVLNEMCKSEDEKASGFFICILSGTLLSNGLY